MRPLSFEYCLIDKKKTSLFIISKTTIYTVNVFSKLMLIVKQAITDRNRHFKIIFKTSMLSKDVVLCFDNKKQTVVIVCGFFS